MKALSQLLLNLSQRSHQSHGPRGGTHHGESVGEVVEYPTDEEVYCPGARKTLWGPGQEHLGIAQDSQEDV